MKMSLSGLILTIAIPAVLVGCRSAAPEDPSTLPASGSHVFISEYRTADGWLEICNPTDSTVSLDGYRLMVDGLRQPMDNAALAPGEYRLIAAVKGLGDAEFFYLADGAGALVDIIDNPVTKKYKSVIRSKDRTGQIFSRTEEHLTPGYPNDEAGRRAYQATRRRPNATGIVFSEILASGDNDYIELHNTTGQRADLSGFGLSDKEDFTSPSSAAPRSRMKCPTALLSMRPFRSRTAKIMYIFLIQRGISFSNTGRSACRKAKASSPSTAVRSYRAVS